jgi:hypothetical protein
MFAIVVAGLACGQAFGGITFNINYTAAVQADANFAAIQNAVNFVKNEFSSTYTDNVTLNFTIDEQPGGLGSSLFSNNYWRGTYAQLKAALAADAKSADDATAVASLPATDPIGGGGNAWYAPSAEAKALGLLTDNSLFDGTYTFASDQLYTYDPNNRQVPGKFDFIGVTEHEFSELMGRTSQSAAFGYDSYDLFRFSAPGTRNFGRGTAYFSIDGGVTNLHNFNAGASGDRQDWDSSDPTDPYNAGTGPNQGHAISAVDVRALDVIGWDLAGVAAVPEPATVTLLSTGALLLAGWRRWKGKRGPAAA